MASTHSPDTGQMRVCTWNIQRGLRLDAVVAAVRSRKAFRGLDLLCLQEASVHAGRLDAALIAEALGAGYDYFQATAQLRRGVEQAHALVWRRDAFHPGEPGIVSLTIPTAVGGPTSARMS